jgi:hypothetical protein
MSKFKIVGMMALITFVMGIVSAGDALAQQKTLKKQLVGTWILVSMYNEQDGKKTEPFGPNPRGVQIFSPDGRFYAITMRSSLPKFASNNRLKGTPEEYQAVVQGSMAYFGTYKVVNEKEHLVGLHMEASTFANWEREDHTRVMVVVGDEIKVTTPRTSLGGTSYVILKRAK